MYAIFSDHRHESLCYRHTHVSGNIIVTDLIVLARVVYVGDIVITRQSVLRSMLLVVTMSV